MQLIHPKKKEKKSSYKHSGLIFLERYKLEEDWEFSHFVQAGLQLNFTVAIDFSTSNGEWRSHNCSLNANAMYGSLVVICRTIYGITATATIRCKYPGGGSTGSRIFSRGWGGGVQIFNRAKIKKRFLGTFCKMLTKKSRFCGAHSPLKIQNYYI